MLTQLIQQGVPRLGMMQCSDAGDILSHSSSSDLELGDCFGDIDEKAGVHEPSCCMDDDGSSEGGLSPACADTGIMSGDDEGTTATSSAGPSQWIVGWNVGSYVQAWCRRGRERTSRRSQQMPFTVGEQVLVTNVVQNLFSLPENGLRFIMDALSVVRTSNVARAICAAGRLLGIEARHVKKLFHGMRHRSFVPDMSGHHTEGILDEADDTLMAACPHAHFVQCNTTRVILAHSVDGSSPLRIVEALYRMQIAGAQVGVPQDPMYSKLVVSLASVALQHLNADDFNADMPGIGIPSDFGVLADGVTMGLGVTARHDTLLVVCLCLASKWTGRLYTPLHSAPAMPLGSHGGSAMASLLVTCMASHAACWNVGVMRARCSAISGDGALCEGGPEHRHSSTAAAEKLWKIMFPNASGQPDGGLSPPLCTVWDPFHRVDIAVWRAVRAVPLAVKVFDMSRQLDYLFGQSEGILFWRHVREPGSRSLRAPGGTRKVEPMSIPTSSQIAEHHIDFLSFPMLYQSLSVL